MKIDFIKVPKDDYNYKVDTIIRLRRERDALLTAAAALVSALGTCHICGGSVLLDDGPTHCEDCSAYCDSHGAPDCPSIHGLYLGLQKAIAQAKAW